MYTGTAHDVDTDIDWAAPPPVAPLAPKPVAATQLVPLWKSRSVLAADDALLVEAQQVTQLRSHCLARPPSASFRDAARYMSYIACATDGLGHRANAHAPTPSPPVLTMSIRAMLETAHVIRVAQGIFDLVCGGSELCRGAPFRGFFSQALHLLTKGILPGPYSDSIAECEWRGARTHSSVASVSKPGISDSSSAAVIPFASFVEKLLTMALLFTSNGFAFVTPISQHVLEVFEAIRHCAVEAASGPAAAAAAAKRLVLSPNNGVAVGSTAAVSVPSPRDLVTVRAGQVSTGFLPPSRPLTYTGASTATASTRPLQVGSQPREALTATFASSGRLPLILTKRHVDNFAPPADLSDAAVGASVVTCGTSSKPNSPRPYSVASDLNAVALRKALHCHELYPTVAPARRRLVAQSSALVGFDSASQRPVDSAGSSSITGTVMSVVVARQVGGTSTGAIQRGVRGGFRTSAVTRHVPWRCVEMDMFSRGAGSRPGDVVDVVEVDGFRMTTAA